MGGFLRCLVGGLLDNLLSGLTDLFDGLFNGLLDNLLNGLIDLLDGLFNGSFI